MFTIKLKHIVVSLVSIFAMSAANVSAQYEPFCSKIEQRVKTLRRDSQLHWNDVLSYGCSIEFSHPQVNIAFEVYRTRRKTRQAFFSTARLFRTERLDEPLQPFEKLGHYGVWNDAIFVASGNKTSHAMILRHEKYIVTLLSTDRQLLFEVEDALRAIF